MSYKQLLSKSTPYAGGTNSCFLNQLPTLVVQTKQLFSKSTPTLVVHPYAGSTTLRWWYWHRWPLLVL